MEAFWCITLGLIVMRMAMKSHMFRPRLKVTPLEHQVRLNPAEDQPSAEDAEKEARKQKDIAELKKQGYTDELIAVIIPTLHND